jgi:hypothetical protein
MSENSTMDAEPANGNGTKAKAGVVPTVRSAPDTEAREPPTGAEPKPRPEIRVVEGKRKSQIIRFQVLLLLHLVYIAAIAFFLGYSVHRDGLWKVKDWDYVKATTEPFIDRSLLWTTVPTFFFSALGLFMRRCYADILELQPFLDLYKQPTRGRKSVLADYRRDLPPTAALKAFKNGHYRSSLALMLTLFFSIIMVPLSSHLLATKLYRNKVQGTALQSTEINLGRLNQNADFSRAFDITSALGVYNGGTNVFSQWMDENYAFPTFIAQNATWNYNTTVEIPNVTGHYGNLANCSFLAANEYTIASLGGGGNTTDATLRLTTERDGCKLEHEVDVEGSKFDMYFFTGAVDCSAPDSNGGNTTPTRLLFLLAWPRPGSSEGLALASQLAVCTPVYGVDVGTLQVSVLDRTRAVQSFTSNNCASADSLTCKGYAPPDGSRPEFRAMSTAIVEHSSSAGAVANTKTKTSTFGSLILSRFDVSRRDQSQPLEQAWPDFEGEMQEDMVDAIRLIYKTFFLTATSVMAFEAAGWPLDFKSARVLVANDVEKLFAVRWVCILVLAVLAASFVVARHAYVLSREMRDWDVDAPANVVEMLGLVCDNEELLAMARDVQSNGMANAETGQFREPFGRLVEGRWNCDEAKFEVEAIATGRSLVVRGLDRR